MLGKNLQAARLAANLTQEEVAKELYFSRQAISRWESGKTEPNLETLISLCQLYQTDLATLTSGIEPRARKKHFHIFGAFGVLAFNFLVGWWAIVAVVLCLGAVYLVLATFLLAPVIMLIAVLTHNPNITFIHSTGLTGFEWWQWLAAVLGCTLGIVLARFVWRLTLFLGLWLLQYLKFNVKSVWS